MDFNKEKFRNVMYYLIKGYDFKNDLGRQVLFILLYFSDFNFFELYEKPLTGESYIKSSYGPEPMHFDGVIDEFINEEKIDVNFKSSSENVICIFDDLKKQSFELTDEELSVLDDVILQFRGNSFSQINEYFQGDIPWRATEDGEIIDYGFVFYRDPEYVKRVYD